MCCFLESGKDCIKSYALIYWPLLGNRLGTGAARADFNQPNMQWKHSSEPEKDGTGQEGAPLLGQVALSRRWKLKEPLEP